MRTQRITIPRIVLHWSPWYRWWRLKLRFWVKRSVRIPAKPGVYQVRRPYRTKLLSIGQTSNLRRRIKDLLKGRHSTGKKIIKKERKETVSKLQIQWAETDRPACVEEELFRRYRRRFGKLPEYIVTRRSKRQS